MTNNLDRYLFRGISDHTREWVYGSLLAEISCIVPHGIGFGDEIRVIPETVGQWTGANDKQGTKIFEGDICQTDHWDGYTGIVVVHGNAWALIKDSFFDRNIKYERFMGNPTSYRWDLIGGECPTAKIISTITGSIHDHLLKGNTDEK